MVDQIKTLTYEELVKMFEENVEENHFSLHDLPTKHLYNFGEIDEDMSERIYLKGIPLFKDKEVMDKLSHYEPYIVGREGLLEVINIYKEKVRKYYESLLEDTIDELFAEENVTAIQKQERHIRQALRHWRISPPINLDENVDVISSSWNFEHAIFELVRLLKTTDFEKQTIIFYGY